MAICLPPEIVLTILEYTEDWELCETVCQSINLHHNLPISAPWRDFATKLDFAILTGKISKCREVIDSGEEREFTKWGTQVMIRFSFIHLLNFFHRNLFDVLNENIATRLPKYASAWNKVDVLEWAKNKGMIFLDNVNEACLDEASRHGAIETLEWWKKNYSIEELKYSENALKSASFMQRIDVLEWWKNSGLPLKIKDVMDSASMAKGNPESILEVLNWWKNSGLHFEYSGTCLLHLSQTGNTTILNWWLHESGLDLAHLIEKDVSKEVLKVATEYGQTEVLDFWLNSKLPIQFRYSDIDEAIEDSKCSPAARENVENWWKKRGFFSSTAAREWMKSRVLS